MVLLGLVTLVSMAPFLNTEAYRRQSYGSGGWQGNNNRWRPGTNYNQWSKYEVHQIIIITSENIIPDLLSLKASGN